MMTKEKTATPENVVADDIDKSCWPKDEDIPSADGSQQQNRRSIWKFTDELYESFFGILLNNEVLKTNTMENLEKRIQEAWRSINDRNKTSCENKHHNKFIHPTYGADGAFKFEGASFDCHL
ncbi:unnamed protein product [Ambrosiozyma monospora]|uniref:Unnamed protein product n=1 Tax=Ambrosiozyma monospora TaxID=43982 RepID=A0ACB5SQR8_AMBMO|nr:unnamed protein product [Ambrosiozyma monospora]